MKVLLLFLFLLSFQVQPACTISPSSLFRLFSYATELVSVIFDFKAIIQDAVNPADNVDTQILAVLENLQKVQNQMMDKLNILQLSVDFNQYLSQISSAQSAISSVNEDFVKFQKASNENGIYLTRKDFIDNYKSNVIDTHLWNLRERAKGTPILSLDAMPLLLSKRLKCSMTGVRLFQRSYLSLMINGYALKGIYTNMTAGDAESEINDSIVHMNESFSGLLTSDKYCIDNYPEYARKDLEEIPSLNDLHKTVQEKYIWLETFMVRYSKRGFRYNAIYANYLRIKNVLLADSNTKVMVFCEKKGNSSAYDETSVKILQDISKYQKARTEDRDNEAAKHILDSVLETTRSLRSNPYAIVIFAEHPDFPIKEIVAGYCANEVSFELQYDIVYEHSDLLWERHTYNNVKYHVHILLPTEFINQPTNDPNDKYKQDVSAFFRVKASPPMLIGVLVFLLYFSNRQYK